MSQRAGAQGGQVSGEIRALISGDTVIAKISGEVVKVSGEVVKISGEIVVAKTSGEVAKISGEVVKISGEHVFVESGTHVVAESGLGVVPQSGVGVTIQSGAAVQISGQHVFVESGVFVAGGGVSGSIVQISGQGVLISGQHVYVESGAHVVAESGLGVIIQSGVAVSVSVSGQPINVVSGFLNSAGITPTWLRGVASGLGVVVNSGVGVQIQSGAGVLISGQHVFVESGIWLASGHVVTVQPGSGQHFVTMNREFWLTDGNFTERWEQGFRKRLYHGRTGSYWKSESIANTPYESWTLPDILPADNTIGTAPWDNAIRMRNSHNGIAVDELYVGFNRSFHRGSIAFEANLQTPAGITPHQQAIGFEVNSGGSFAFATCLVCNGGQWMLWANNPDGVRQLNITLRHPGVYSRYALSYDPPWLVLYEAPVASTTGHPLECTAVLHLGPIRGKATPFMYNEDIAVSEFKVGDIWLYELPESPQVENRISGYITQMFDLTELAGQQTSFTERWEWLQDPRDRQQIFYRKYQGRGYPYSSVWRTEASGLVPERWTIPTTILGEGTVHPWENALMMTNSKDGSTIDEIYVGSKRTFKPPCIMRICARIPDVNGGANGACGSGTLYAFGFENNSQGAQSVADVYISQSNLQLYMANITPPGSSSGEMFNRINISGGIVSIWNADGGGSFAPFNSVGQSYIPLKNPDHFADYYLDFDPPFLRLWQASSGNRYPYLLSELKMQKEWAYDNMQAFICNESAIVRSGFAVAQWTVYERNPKGKYTDLIMSGAHVPHSGVYLAGTGGSGGYVTTDLDCAQFKDMAITLQTTHMSGMIAGTRLYLLGMCDQSGTVVDSENINDAFAYIEPVFISGQMTSSTKTVNVDMLPRYVRLLIRNLAITSAGPYRVYGHFNRGL